MQQQEKSSLPMLELVNRQLLKLNSVQNVDVFDEEQIVLQTELGKLQIKGQHLNVTSLDVEDGNLQVDGVIDSVLYLDEKKKRGRKKKSGNVLARIFS